MNSDTKNQNPPTLDCSTAQQLKTYPQLAQTLIDNGYTVMPIKKESKVPAIAGWTKPCYKPPLTGFNNCGIAIKTGVGENPIIAIDIDTMDEKIAKEVLDKIFEIAGTTIYRIGQYPKMIIVYRLAAAA